MEHINVFCIQQQYILHSNILFYINGKDVIKMIFFFLNIP